MKFTFLEHSLQQRVSLNQASSQRHLTRFHLGANSTSPYKELHINQTGDLCDVDRPKNEWSMELLMEVFVNRQMVDLDYTSAWRDHCHGMGCFSSTSAEEFVSLRFSLVFLRLFLQFTHSLHELPLFYFIRWVQIIQVISIGLFLLKSDEIML